MKIKFKFNFREGKYICCCSQRAQWLRINLDGVRVLGQYGRTTKQGFWRIRFRQRQHLACSIHSKLELITLHDPSDCSQILSKCTMRGAELLLLISNRSFLGNNSEQTLGKSGEEGSQELLTLKDPERGQEKQIIRSKQTTQRQTTVIC